MILKKRFWAGILAILLFCSFANADLVLWNKLDSTANVTNSEFGLDGTYSAGSLVSGRHMGAIEMQHDEISGVTFPYQAVSKNRGTIEVWIKLVGRANGDGVGTDLYLFRVYDSGSGNCYFLMFNNNDGLGGSGICGSAGDRYEVATSYFTTGHTYGSLLGDATDWHHYALVWDEDGIPGLGGEKAAIYLDGVKHNGRYTIHGDSTFEDWTGSTDPLYLHGPVDQYGSGSMIMDNLKVYDHAKTDFSDRFTENSPILVFWNRLDAAGNVASSDVGLGGTVSGGSFVSGKFGNAYSATYTEDLLLNFPIEIFPGDEGCIEFWAKLEGFPEWLANGNLPNFFEYSGGSGGNLSLQMNNNDGGGGGGLVYRIGNYYKGATGVYGAVKYESILGSGQTETWHHYALVWNNNGMAYPGVAGYGKAILFLDGEVETTLWEDPADLGFNLVGGQIDFVNNSGGSGTVLIDNIMIYNYEKTDFSGRFYESGVVPDDLDPPTANNFTKTSGATHYKEGAVLTFTFDVTEELMSNPTVLVNNNATSFSSSSNLTYTYTYTVQAGENVSDPAVSVSVATDESGNPVQGSGTISGAIFDTTLPQGSALTKTSPSANYRLGEIITFTFDVDEALGGNPTVTVSGNAASYQGLAGSTYTYTYTIQIGDDGSDPAVAVTGADLAGNALSESWTLSGVTIETLAGAPTNFTGSYNASDNRYELSWDHGHSHIGYEVEIKISTYPWFTMDNSLPSTQTQYYDESFIEGVTVKYRIRSLSAGGEFFHSLPLELGEDVLVELESPISVDFGTFNSAQKKVTILWSAQSGSHTAFVIERSENGAPFIEIATVSADVTTYEDTTVEYGKTYSYRIRAINDYGGESDELLYDPVNAGLIPIPTGNEYYYEVVDSPTGDASDTGEINLKRRFSDTVQAVMNIDADALGISLSTAGLQDLVITKNETSDLVEMSIPTASALAQAVNNDATGTLVIPVVFTGLPTDKKPIIILNGKAITDYDLNIFPEYVDYVKNIVWNDLIGSLSFDITHFSTYTIGIVEEVTFTESSITREASENYYILVKVLDSLSEGVEGAPVTFNVESGDGRLASDQTQVTATTNAQGFAGVWFTFPSAGDTVVSAESDGVTSDPNITMSVGAGAGESNDADGDGMPDDWEVANGLNPSVSSDMVEDPDSDGLDNIHEYRKNTDPQDADSDNDDVNDKFDAYPNNVSLEAFDSGLTTEEPAAQSFDGTADNTNVIANGSDIEVIYSAGSVTGDAGQDSSIFVDKISGAAYPGIQDGNLALSYSSSIYKGLEPGESYSVRFFFINRGNDDDSFSISSILTQGASRWTKNEINSNLSNVSPWQLGNVEVVAQPTLAEALEPVTLSVQIDLSPGTAVNYDAFTNAYIGATYQDEGHYGGLQQAVNNTFRLEAEGYELTVLDRSVTISAPAGYSGDADDLVPGSKIKYFIVVKNESTAVATSINLTDVIPQNCHLYYTNLPGVTGATAWEWQGVTNNSATSETADAVKFVITIPASGTVTAQYSVTID